MYKIVFRPSFNKNNGLKRLFYSLSVFFLILARFRPSNPFYNRNGPEKASGPSQNQNPISSEDCETADFWSLNICAVACFSESSSFFIL